MLPLHYRAKEECPDRGRARAGKISTVYDAKPLSDILTFYPLVVKGAKAQGNRASINSGLANGHSAL